MKLVNIFLAQYATARKSGILDFWVGVRTPWTLANERVWNDTHRLAGKLFVLSGAIAFLLTLAGVSLMVSICVIGAAAFWSVAYSLIAYKRLERRGEI